MSDIMSDDELIEDLRTVGRIIGHLERLGHDKGDAIIQERMEQNELRRELARRGLTSYGGKKKND